MEALYEDMMLMGLPEATLPLGEAAAEFEAALLSEGAVSDVLRRMWEAIVRLFRSVADRLSGAASRVRTSVASLAPEEKWHLTHDFNEQLARALQALKRLQAHKPKIDSEQFTAAMKSDLFRSLSGGAAVDSDTFWAWLSNVPAPSSPVGREYFAASVRLIDEAKAEKEKAQAHLSALIKELQARHTSEDSKMLRDSERAQVEVFAGTTMRVVSLVARTVGGIEAEVRKHAS